MIPRLLICLLLLAGSASASDAIPKPVKALGIVAFSDGNGADCIVIQPLKIIR